MTTRNYTVSPPVMYTGDMVLSSRIHNLVTNKIVHHDRNGLITSYFFHFGAMISSLAKVMGLQSRQKQGPKFVYNQRT